MGLAIASFTYGGLLGFFVIGRSAREYSKISVVSGFVVSLLVMVAVVSLTDVAWPWFTIIGVTVMVGASSLLNLIVSAYSGLK